MASSSSSLITEPRVVLAESAIQKLAIQFVQTTTRADLLSAEVPLLSLFQYKILSALTVYSQDEPTYFPWLVQSILKPGLFSERLRGVFAPFAKADYPSGSLTRANCMQVINYEKFRELYPDESQLTTGAVTYCFQRILADAVAFNDLSDLKSFANVNQIFLGDEDDHASLFFKELMAVSVFTSDASFMSRTPLELGVQSDLTSIPHRVRMGVRNVVFLISDVIRLQDFYLVDRGRVPSHLNTSTKVTAFLSVQARLIGQQIDANVQLTPVMKRILKSAVVRYLQKVIDANDDLQTMKWRYFKEDALRYYQKVILTKEMQSLACIPVTISHGSDLKKQIHKTSKRSEFDVGDVQMPSLEYVLEHQYVFENLIFRLNELIDYINNSTHQAEKCLKVVKELPLVLKFGNTERLIERLNDAKANPQKIDAAISTEVDLFLKEKNQPAILSTMIPYLRGEGAQLASAARHSDYQHLEESWTIFSRAFQTLLRPSIVTMERVLLPLFSQIPRVPKPASKSVRRDTPLSSVPSSLPSVELVSSSSEPSPSLSEASSSSGPSRPPFFSQLESSRVQLRQMFGALFPGRSEMTQQALKDGLQHFDDLLCSMRRLQSSAQSGSLTPQQLHTFVVDCVYHCSLGVEQLLSALDRDSNGIVTQEQLQPRLTHKLFIILQNIDMGDGDLPPRVRRWIREISGGEILLRDFNLFTEKESPLQNLLWTDFCCLTAQSDASADQVFQALSTYLSPLGEFLDSIQDRFRTVKKSKPVEFKDNLFHLCTQLCHNLATIPLLPQEGFVSPLSELYQCLDELQGIDPNVDVACSLGNIRNNLMVILEEKMQAIAHLEPINAASDLGSLLYTCQNIAESIFTHTLQIRGIPLSFEEAAQHDLMAHVEKLGIRSVFSKDEIDFLARGKASRQLVRYPHSRAKEREPIVQQKSRGGRGRSKGHAQGSSRSAKSSTPSRLDAIQEMLHWGRALSAKQSASDDLQGFLPADAGQAKKLEEIKRFALEDVALLCSIVKKVLTSCR